MIFKSKYFFNFALCVLSTYSFANEQKINTSDLIISKDVSHDMSLPLRYLQIRTPQHHHYNKFDVTHIISSENKTNNALLLKIGSFQGIGVGLPNYQVTELQPDTNAQAGLTQFVEYANPDLAVFDKVGNLLPGFPKPGKSLWAGFGGVCESSAAGRMTVSYDILANRWVISQFASVNAQNGPFFHCVAVSTGDDATGSYYRYAFQLDSYSPHSRLAFWPDAYYLGFTMVGRLSNGPRMCAIDRASMLNGNPANMICKQLTNTVLPLEPVSFLNGLLPVTGSPGYFFALNPPDKLTVYKFHVDFANPANTAISTVNLTVDDYVPACLATNGESCAVQPNTANLLNIVSDKPMTRLVYRHFSGGYASIVLSHVIEGPQPKFAPAIRWYELRILDNISTLNPIIHQQSTLAPDSKNRYAPSCNLDRNGNIAIAYTVSSSRVHPSPELAWRMSSDPLNTLTIQPLYTSTGSQTTVHNWGNTSRLTTDPANRCKMYFASEYLKSTGFMNWGTVITTFSLPGCI